MRSFLALTTIKRFLIGGFTGLIFVSSSVYAAEERILEEVVTTAQRRAENIQEVPISVASLAGEEFDNLFDGGEDIRALATRVPSLYAESSNGRLAPRFYVRGLGNQDFDLAASQPVSVIFDEVVQENVILKSFPLFDVERVEVLRGPQGTLFGRNTPAGIVKFDTRKPTQDMDGYLSTSYAPGDPWTFSLQGAQGGPLSDTLSARVSLLVQSRSDWIDNNVPSASDFNSLGGKDAMGGFGDVAYRAQLLYQPNDQWSVLANLHGRNYDGTASIFRANVIGPGSDGFNSNYDRDSVTYDEGGNNPQEANATGGSIKVDVELNDRTTLTSITAHEVVKNRSLGDIDGGFGADFFGDPALVGPCPPGGTGACIPFNSQTQDGLNNLDQFTQEVRIAQQTTDSTFWQGGFYYFTSEFAVQTVPFFIPNKPLVSHENDAWALFAHVSHDFSDTFTLTGGVRYTDDEKEARVFGAPVPQSPVSVSDEEISWDLSGLFTLNDQVNLYGRLASGFRAPTIQARDVAFFGVPSTAKSETIQSIEAGFKSTLAGNRLRLNGAIFHYTIDDQQLSAIGGGGNFVRLVNAEEGTGVGIELDAEFIVNENLSLRGGFSTVDTELDDQVLVIPPCGSGLCTVLDPLDTDGNAIVDGNSFANAPEYILTFAADYARPWGPEGEFFFFTDWAFQGETQFVLYESAESLSDDSFEAGFKAGYRNLQHNWEVALYGRNITDEENVKGIIDFNNLTGFDNEPRVVGISFRKSWSQ
ncbi:MAG: TonB-dependent receptor [Gammaproteobacteria bacterium]|nr:TonB-dependent receptor [Gammaproteobacteria bacterium]MDH3768274.1 TonB-dependent receptor [Gammaproteobacteria bacterium]